MSLVSTLLYVINHLFCLLSSLIFLLLAFICFGLGQRVSIISGFTSKLRMSTSGRFAASIASASALPLSSGCSLS